MQAGATIGPYELRHPLWTDAVSQVWDVRTDGGPAAVYRGVRQDAGVRHRMRIYDPVGRRDREALLRTIERVAPLRHPAFTPIHDVGTVDERVYVVTGDVGMLTLGDAIGRWGPCGAARAVDLLEPLAIALDALHDVGCAHGAIGPRTVLVDADRERLVLTDFGLDDRLGRGRASGASAEELPYVAPEQTRAHGTRPESDQYALACALAHLTTGRPPYASGASAAGRGASSTASDGPDAAAVRTPTRIAMAGNPADRHPSCVALLAAVDAPAPPAGAQPGPRAADAGVPPGGRLGRWLRRGPGPEQRLW
jgi:serine/threonine protein kinase